MDIKKDMIRLEKIMRIFSLDPVKITKGGNYVRGGTSGPIARLIFCNVLADKYEELRKQPKIGGHLVERPLREVLYKFLGLTSMNSVKAQLRSEAIQSIEYHKEYMNKYKMVKAGFTNDERYLALVAQQTLRDEAQEEMTRLTLEIVNQ